MKHARSYDLDDITDTNSKHITGKVPLDSLYRKSRSLSSIELQSQDVNKKQKQSETEENQDISRQFSGESQEIKKSWSASYEHMIPALGRLHFFFSSYNTNSSLY